MQITNEFAILIILPSIIYAQSLSSPTVETKHGKVKGIRKEVCGKFVDIFYGIRYAKPPVGNLKFKKPQPAEPWNGTLDATKKPNCCIQTNGSEIHRVKYPNGYYETFTPKTERSEDCLHLTVYTPSLRQCDLKLYPVLFFIHGGGFLQGASTLDIYDGSYLSAYKDFVVVTPNYRLGPAGFLYLGTEDAPGNMGLHDINLALDWVRGTIKSFCGNPDNIIVMGTSSGGASVSAMMLSPHTRDKFHKAVIQSGTVNTQWGSTTPDVAIQRANTLAEMVGCKNEAAAGNKAKLAECFRKASSSDLDRKSYAVATEPVCFPPTVDGKFLPKSPVEMLLQGEFKKPNMPVLIGNVAQEVSAHLTNLFPQIDFEGTCLPKKTDVDTMIKTVFGKLPERALDMIKVLYNDGDNADDGVTIRQNMIRMMSDSTFICPSKFFATAIATYNVPTYYYEFNHATKKRYFAEWIGAYHGEDIHYFFGCPFTNPKRYTEDERLLSERMMDYLSHFAKVGKPVSDESWPKFLPGKHFYQELNTSGPKISKGPCGKECEFWNVVLPKLIQDAVRAAMESQKASAQNQKAGAQTQIG